VFCGVNMNSFLVPLVVVEFKYMKPQHTSILESITPIFTSKFINTTYCYHHYLFGQQNHYQILSMDNNISWA
jgi:hypothetical protein